MYLRWSMFVSAELSESHICSEPACDEDITPGYGRAAKILDRASRSSSRSEVGRTFVTLRQPCLDLDNTSTYPADDVPQEVLDKEREILSAELLQQGKPENMLEKILPGKLNKFYQETCLLDQQWLLSDDKLSVAKVSQSTFSLFFHF